MVTIILQVIAVVTDIYIAFTNNKKHILFLTFLYNVLSMTLYLILRDYAAIISCILIVSRSFIYLFQDKIKKLKVHWIVPLLFISMHCIMGISKMENYWHILTIIAPCIICYLLWFEKSRQNMRLEQIVSDCLWLTYNLHSGLYILSISRVVSIASGFIAYIRNIQRTPEEV